MNWWQTLLISISVSFVTLLITMFSNFIVNRNKKLQFFIQRKSIDNSGYFRFELTIYNPAKIPQFYDSLYVSFYLNHKKFDETRLETSNDTKRNAFGERQGFLVPSDTIQSHSISSMVVYGKNNAILNADEIKIEYNTYWAKPNGKSRLVSSTLMKREQIETLINEKSNTGL